jgi:hypothetical protein
MIEKRIFILLILYIFLSCTGISPKSFAGDDPFTRIGFSIGSKTMIGLYVERVYENWFWRAEGGFLFSIAAVSLTANRYFGEDPWRPYAGAGFLYYRNAFGKEYSNMLVFPWGLDYKLNSRNWVSLEFNSCIPLGKDSDIGPPLFKELIIPIPALSFKYRMNPPSNIIPSL